MSHQVYNTLGLIGVFVTLAAYFFLQIEKIKSNSTTYSFINLFGSLLIILSLYDRFNLPAVMMEISWTLISLYGLSKALYFRRRNLR